MSTARTAALLFAIVVASPALAEVGLSVTAGSGYPGHYPPPSHYRPAPPYDHYSNGYSPRVIDGTAVETYEGVPPPPVIIYGRPAPPYWHGNRPYQRDTPHYRHDHRDYRNGYSRSRDDHRRAPSR